VAETATGLSTIVFTDEKVKDFAMELHSCLKSAGISMTEPEFRPPSEAFLGTPEVIVTIVVTSAVRALLISGLGVLEKYLEAKVAENDKGKRFQIILVGLTEPPQRFPLGLRSATLDVIHSFIAKVKVAIEKL
jgi:hypothetical protein